MFEGRQVCVQRLGSDELDELEALCACGFRACQDLLADLVASFDKDQAAENASLIYKETNRIRQLVQKL
jgi:hypothetical protein